MGVRSAQEAPPLSRLIIPSLHRKLTTLDRWARHSSRSAQAAEARNISKDGPNLTSGSGNRCAFLNVQESDGIRLSLVACG